MNKLEPWVNYIAKDADGSILGFTERPEYSQSFKRWVTGSSNATQTIIISAVDGDCRDTLVEV